MHQFFLRAAPILFALFVTPTFAAPTCGSTYWTNNGGNGFNYCSARYFMPDSFDMSAQKQYIPQYATAGPNARYGVFSIVWRGLADGTVGPKQNALFYSNGVGQLVSGRSIARFYDFVGLAPGTEIGRMSETITIPLYWDSTLNQNYIVAWTNYPNINGKAVIVDIQFVGYYQ